MNGVAGARLALAFYAEKTYNKQKYERMGTMDKRIDEYLHQLALRGFTPHYFERAEQALEYLFSQLPHDCAVGIGGSTTVTQLGVREALRARGNEVLFHSETPRDKWCELLPRVMNAYAYICSANAISGDGRIWEIDGTGNRLSALCYGPQRIFMLCGVNKLVDGGREEALRHMKQHACPLNARRLKLDTPCATSGECPFPEGRYSPRCICNLTLEIGRVPGGRTLHVIIIGEELGY